MSLKVTQIGCGGMGSAMASRLARTAGIALTVCDRHPEKVAAATSGTTSRAEPDARAAVREADAVLVVVKPKAVLGLLRELAPEVPDACLVISCAAGLPLARLQEAVPGRAVARTMPNIGAAHGVSTTAYTLGDRCEKKRDNKRIRAVFGVMGEARELADEEQMHHATALAGSGPAFFLLALEAMVDAGVSAGMSPEDADAFARGALRAAAPLADAGGETPAEIRARIASPGGTTEAGLGALEDAGARAAFGAAVHAAMVRSREMASE